MGIDIRGGNLFKAIYFLNDARHMFFNGQGHAVSEKGDLKIEGILEI